MMPCFDQPDEKEPDCIAIANEPADKAYQFGEQGHAMITMYELAHLQFDELVE